MKNNQKGFVGVTILILILLGSVFIFMRTKFNDNKPLEKYSTEIQGRKISFLKPSNFDVKVTQQAASVESRGSIAIEPGFCGVVVASLIWIDIISDKNTSENLYGGKGFVSSIDDYLKESGAPGSNYELKKTGETYIGSNRFYKVDTYSYGELWGNGYVNFSPTSTVSISVNRRLCLNGAYEANKDKIQSILDSIEI